MNTKSFVHSVGRLLSWSCVGLGIFGLLFRLLIWASWVPPPDEPYGASDVVELYVGFALVSVAMACVAVGVGVLAISALRETRLGWRLVFVGVATPVAYYFMYSVMPSIKLW